MNKPYEHIIWDLDHTLWDFDTNSKETITELLHDFKLVGAPVMDVSHFLEDYIRINRRCWDLYQMGQMDKATLRYTRFQQAFELHGVNTDSSRALSDEFCSEYIIRCPKKNALVEGTLEVLDYLKSKSYKMCIMTNGFIEAQHVKMHASGLNPYFNHVFISENLKAKKPDPKAYHAVLNALNAQVDQCVMIGDSASSDIQGAVNVGMDSIHFLPKGLEDTKATHAIQRLVEVKEIL
ncbi:MAG: YjjG family noncanonical pyrimidine nucleotidase [Flavobacteriales bacterium]